jgi:hypothetical protein
MNPTSAAKEDIFDLTFFSPDLYELLIRFGVNMLFITIIIRYIYYRKTSNKDYLFTLLCDLSDFIHDLFCAEKTRH